MSVEVILRDEDTIVELPVIAAILAPSVPSVLVYLIGAVLAVIKLPVHRQSSACALTGFVLLLLGRCVGSYSTLMTLPSFRGQLTIAQLAPRIALLNLLVTFLTVAGMVFILLAIFSDREPRQIDSWRDTGGSALG